MADNTSDFFSANAFRRACERSGKKKKDIAADLGVTPTTLSSLLSGRSTPSLKSLTKMVDVFGGELADFLDMPARKDWELKHYRIAAGFTQAALAHELGVAPSAVSGWELGKYPPGSTALHRMATLFDVATDELAAVVSPQDSGQSEPEPVSGQATLSLAETLAETVLGFSASALEVAEREDIPIAARQQLNREIRARSEQALTLLATLIPELPTDSRRRAISLVKRLTEVHELVSPN